VIVFQGRQIQPRSVTIQVRWFKPILPGVSQELGEWVDDFKVTNQERADHAEELIAGSPWSMSEYRVKIA